MKEKYKVQRIDGLKQPWYHLKRDYGKINADREKVLMQEAKKFCWEILLVVLIGH